MILRILLRRRRDVVERAAFRLLRRGLLAGGLLILGYVGAMYAYRAVFQAYGTWMFDRAIANAPPPSGRVIPKPPAGPLIGRLSIPRLNISVMVNEGVGAATLGVAAGHIPSTGRPGAPGNIGLAAHRDTLFRNLKDVRKDDEITLATLEGSYSYRVEWFRIVNPAEVWVLEAVPDGEMLTLVTCYPFNYIGPAPKRFIVRARRITSKPQANTLAAQPRALPSLTSRGT